MVEYLVPIKHLGHSYNFITGPTRSICSWTVILPAVFISIFWVHNTLQEETQGQKPGCQT